MALNLYKISQTKNQGWNIYTEAVVCAKDEQSARLIHPHEGTKGEWWKNESEYEDWVMPDDVTVLLIGSTEMLHAGDVVCSSNTGA